MVLPRFGIPAQEVSFSALQDMVQLQGHALAEAGKAAVVPVVQELIDNGKSLQAVTRPLLRSIQGRISSNNTKLVKVTEPLGAALVSRSGAIQSALAGVVSGTVRPAVSSPVPTTSSVHPGPISPPQMGQVNGGPGVPLPAETWWLTCPICIH